MLLKIFWIFICISIIKLYECREDFRIHCVNMTDGRKDMSIIGTPGQEGVIFKLVDKYTEARSVVRATFIEQINSTGWGHLSLRSSSEYSDYLQAYFSGVIEGAISQQLIAAHWSNTYEGYCSKSSSYCKKLTKYLKENFLSLVHKSRNANGFLKMIRLQLWQIKGLQDGYDGNWRRNSSEIDEDYLLKLQDQLFNLYLLQADCDLSALSKILGGYDYHKSFTATEAVGDDRCSAFIKYVKGSIYSGHVTWSPYNNMLRLTKLYDFPYRVNANEQSSPFVPARELSFSSYPGQLSSLDDFYITSAGLVTLETTISNYNSSLWKILEDKASEIILEYARAQGANRLATSGAQWSSLFSTNNSGTYNNQWMIIDNNEMKKHRYGERIPDGTLYIVEQLPGLIASEDVTDHLRLNTYWASYNLPYNKKIWHLGNFQANLDKYGDYFNYNKSPRAKMFKRNYTNVVDPQSMMRLMRYNDFEHDPLAKCDCSPPFSATNGISSRSDLNLKSGRYPFSTLGYRLNGGVDMKFTTSELAASMQFIGINGPTYDQQPVFDWKEIKNNPMKHNMHPIRFQFPPVMTPFN